MKTWIVANLLIIASLVVTVYVNLDLRAQRDAYQRGYHAWMEYGEREHLAALRWRNEVQRLARYLANTTEQLAIAEQRAAAAESLLPVAAQDNTALDQRFLDWARPVARCESTNNPQARNGTQWGLLQIDIPSHRGRIERLGFRPEDMLEPIPNLIVAQDIWREQGAAPWPHCGRVQ
jgi:hypothetical protein